MKKNVKNIFAISLCLLLAVLTAPGAYAQNVKVAIAANLQPVMKALQTDFKQRTGITVDAISGPSGGLSTQIKNGAPFDVFLSADTNFPAELFNSGFALQKPVVYASGTLIICSNQKLNFTKWTDLLRGSAVQKIAIGNPAIAPYGKAAQEALTQAGIYEQVKSKIVLGESITQVNTYITTGVAQVGFTTLSLVKDTANKTQLYWAAINPKTYKPIQQGMALLKHAENNAQAAKFYQYILSPAAKKIFIQYGYHVQ